MLTESEFKQYIAALNFSDAAIQEIDPIRTLGPSRRVAGRFGNVCVRLTSNKMKRIIQAESRKVEYAFLLTLEMNKSALEIYDQPPPIKFNYKLPNGRHHSHLATPDYFVIWKNFCEWIETKPEEELQKLAKEKPYLYQLTEDGVWLSPPGEAYARSLGFSFRILSTKDINYTLSNNAQFLHQYFHPQTPDVSTHIVNKVTDLFQKCIYLPLIDLLNAGEEITGDHIYTLIAKGKLHVDLERELLQEPTKAKVFLNRLSCEAMQIIDAGPTKNSDIWEYVIPEVGQEITWDGKPFTINAIGENDIYLSCGREMTSISKDNFERLLIKGIIKAMPNPEKAIRVKVMEILSSASDENKKTALKRQEIIRRFEADEDTSAQASNRTIKRWQKRTAHAELAYGEGFLGLLPQTNNRGNREEKMRREVAKLMNDFIESKYETIKQETRKSVYIKLQAEYEKLKLTPPCFNTFCTAIKKRADHMQTLKRKGKKAAYQEAPFHWQFEFTMSRHGARPLEICHIDHTLLDIELVDSALGKNLGRPWLTLMMDAFSRRAIAFYLSFDKPSYESCMMVMRECVNRIQCLPQIIVTDKGKEFDSIDYEYLLARYSVTKMERPPSQARFGSVLERMFGSINTQFLYTLLGNTQMTKNVRQMSKEVNPKTHACWTLHELEIQIAKWLYEVYDQNIHQTLGCSPQDAYAQGMHIGGHRLHRRIPYDEAFIINTLPSSRPAKVKIHPSKGVRTNYLNYWNDIFRDPRFEGDLVRVKPDPFNAGEVYAYVNKTWVNCKSENYTHFANRTVRECKVASQEMKRNKRLYPLEEKLNGFRIAQFQMEKDGKETELIENLKKNDTRLMLAKRGMINGNISVGIPSSENAQSSHPDLDLDKHRKSANQNIRVLGGLDELF